MSKVIFKDHAILRMLERDISEQEVLEVLHHGEVVEKYDDDFPYPSCLMYKMLDTKPLHIVVADNRNDEQKIIVTVYIPDSANFASDYKTRII